MAKARRTASDELREMADKVAWYEPADPTPREQCPCCDHITLPERSTYLICPVCYWEDDGHDVDRLDDESGPNRMTLRAGRENFKSVGACSREMLQHVLPIAAREDFEFRPRQL